MTLYVVVTETANRELARSIAGALQEIIQPEPDALTIFEQGQLWRVEAYYTARPDGEALAQALAEIVASSLPSLTVQVVPDLNWVALSQAALPPVQAGRFVIHGSHDTDRVVGGRNAILIDAGEAFGTAHHATTFGCLTEIDRLGYGRHPRQALDLGCGSGVLAIALARSMPHLRLWATDIDAQSVLVARDNMRRNGVAMRVAVLEATGLAHAVLRRVRQFDLIVANILAGPLIAMAPAIAPRVAVGGQLILSGILVPQAAAVIAAYRAAGFRLISHRRRDGWSTLVCQRLGSRPAVASGRRKA